LVRVCETRRFQATGQQSSTCTAPTVLALDGAEADEGQRVLVVLPRGLGAHGAAAPVLDAGAGEARADEHDGGAGDDRGEELAEHVLGVAAAQYTLNLKLNFETSQFLTFISHFKGSNRVLSSAMGFNWIQLVLLCAWMGAAWQEVFVVPPTHTKRVRPPHLGHEREDHLDEAAHHGGAEHLAVGVHGIHAVVLHGGDGVLKDGEEAERRADNGEHAGADDEFGAGDFNLDAVHDGAKTGDDERRGDGVLLELDVAERDAELHHHNVAVQVEFESK
jgi:hypothetical protein